MIKPTRRYEVKVRKRDPLYSYLGGGEILDDALKTVRKTKIVGEL